MTPELYLKVSAVLAARQPDLGSASIREGLAPLIGVFE